jgi:hypothetical protein
MTSHTTHPKAEDSNPLLRRTSHKPKICRLLPGRSKARQSAPLAMASPDAALTEPERWRDLDMLLTRPGNLVEASFDPSPTVSRRRRLALLHLSLSV